MMGKKGAKLTQATTDYCGQVVETLAALGEVKSRKMFGGHGIFESGAMFALIDSEGTLFFKFDASNQARFDEADAPQHGRMPYAAVPATVLEDDDLLLDWAQASIDIAHQSKKK